MTATTLPTRNPGWGFWGTITHHADAETAWPLAMTAIATATSCAPAAVRDFLDSRYGRHFADDVADALARGATLKDAIGAAVARWMGWTIARRTEREMGIPRGLPYLTGFVTHCEIEAEASG